MKTYIQDELGGHQYCLEIDDDIIIRQIDRAFRKALVWYDEVAFETKPVTKVTNFQGYILRSAFQKSLDDVIEIWGVSESMFTVMSRFDSDLWGVKQLVLDINAIGDLAAWIGIRPQIEQVLSSLPEFHLTPDRLLIANLKLDTVRATVAYTWVPSDVSKITYQKATQWVLDYALARCKLTLGHSRSKFQQGGLNFQMDGNELKSEANTDIQRLEADLKDLQFNYHIAR